MPIFELNDELIFPRVNNAEPDGLLAIGGDLRPERLLFAFSLGIFPWFSDADPILWWSPDPRFVIYPQKAKFSKSTQRSAKKFDIKINKNFKSVINSCSEISRKNQDGTWITQDMASAYYQLHKLGYAYSFEAYYDDILAGGLYGVLCGKIFIGESMFHNKTDASKVAFKALVIFCLTNNIQVIDCQFHTNHLERLGGEHITRNEYLNLLERYFNMSSM